MVTVNTFSVFLPIAKLDEDQRLVYGYASTPRKDLQDERVSLDAVKGALPDYMEWGNIREMHQLSAVGTTKQANVDDKGLYICGKVVDDPAWSKVKEGVYKGFSIGGEAVQKVGDEITKLRITEISLVDRPANPDCKIESWKADNGGVAQPIAKSALLLVPRFSPPSDESASKTNTDAPMFDANEVGVMAGIITKLNKRYATEAEIKARGKGDGFSAPATPANEEERADLKPAPIAGTDRGGEQTFTDEEKALIAEKRAAAKKPKVDDTEEDTEGKLKPGEVEKEKPKSDAEKILLAAEATDWLESLGSDTAERGAHMEQCSYCAVQKAISQREDVSPADKERAQSEYGNVKFADEKNKKYPIDTEKHIRAAWNYINKEKNAAKYEASEVASIKSKIVAAWKDKIDKDGPPSAADKKAKKTLEGTLKKWGLESSTYIPTSNLTQLAMVFDAVCSMAQSLRYESAMEHGDAADEGFAEKVDSLKNMVGSLIAEYAGHEVEEEPEEEAEKVIKTFESFGITEEMVKMADTIFNKRHSAAHKASIHRAGHHVAAATHHCAKASGHIGAAHKAFHGAKKADGFDSKEFPHGDVAEHINQAHMHMAHLADHLEMAAHHLGKVSGSWTGEGKESPAEGEDGVYKPESGIDQKPQSALTEGDVPDYEPDEPYDGKADKPKTTKTAAVQPTAAETAAVKAATDALNAANIEKAKMEGRLEYMEKMMARIPGGNPTARIFAVDKVTGITGDAKQVDDKLSILREGVVIDPNDPDSMSKAAGKMIGNMIGHPRAFGKSLVSPEYKGREVTKVN